MGIDENQNKKEFFITTNKEVVINDEIVWDKKSLIKILTDKEEEVKNYLDKNFKDKYCNIYKNIPLRKLLFPGGVVKVIEL